PKFGCAAYRHINKKTGRKKFHKKSMLGYLVGYDSTGAFITPAPRRSRCHEMSYSRKTNSSVCGRSRMATKSSHRTTMLTIRTQTPNLPITLNKTRSQLIPSYTMNLRSKHLLQLQLHRMTTGRGQQQANFQIDENGEPLHELSRLSSKAI